MLDPARRRPLLRMDLLCDPSAVVLEAAIARLRRLSPANLELIARLLIVLEAADGGD